MLTVTGSTGSTVELNWLPPLHPNGAIRYYIEYETVMTPRDSGQLGNVVTIQSSSSFYYNLTLRNEFRTYNVTVVAVGTQDMGSKSAIVLVCPGRNREGVWYTHIYMCIDTYPDAVEAHT